MQATTRLVIMRVTRPRISWLIIGNATSMSVLGSSLLFWLLSYTHSLRWHNKYQNYSTMKILSWKLDGSNHHTQIYYDSWTSEICRFAHLPWLPNVDILIFWVTNPISYMERTGTVKLELLIKLNWLH